MADPSEFDRFYLATAPRVLAHLYLITGEMSEAQDCTQEAYARAWQRWDSLTGDGQQEPLAWVRSVGCRLAISNWRRAMAQTRAWRRHGPVADVREPSSDVVAVRQALAKLSAGQRAVIVLHHFADLRVEDVAQQLRIPVGTVKARLSRGRAALAVLLADESHPKNDSRIGTAKERFHA